MLKKISLIIIKFYQKYLTILAFGSCRYYPTCSEYAKMNFEKNSFIIASFFSIKRILSCHQLSRGGFDYPTVTKTAFKKSQKCFVYSKKLNIKYFYIPYKNRYILIKKI
jgi:putative membrane protein insertion efficiency factor